MLSPAYPSFDPFSVAWRLPHDLALAFRPVGRMTAVFNAESGDTHLLARVAGEFVRRLAGGEVVEGDALREATAIFEQAGFDAGRVLRELHVLGLAEPFEP